VAAQDPEVVGERDDGLFGVRLGIRVCGLERDVFGNGWDVGVGLRRGQSAQQFILRHDGFQRTLKSIVGGLRSVLRHGVG
jgi:hypothetical protein